MKRRWVGLLIAALLAGSIFPQIFAAEATWKAGTAAIKITPQASMWMAGYAARNKPSEGIAQDLFAKALAIEDSRGARLVIVTMDLIGVLRPLRDWLESQVQPQHALEGRWLVINASHTHCGPELRGSKLEGTAAASEQVRLSAEYTEQLQQKLLAVVDQALARLEPAQLDYLHARAGFAMNRRRPTERGFTNAPYSDGPVDHDVPVLRVTDPQGKKLRAVLFGYACHNTTLSYYKFCGDYAGYAQQYLEEAHPQVTAMFMAGCGADQNPYPRRSEELVQYHGRTLAVAVEAALETVPRPLLGPLDAALEEVTLEFAPPPAREELERIAAGKKQPDARHAQRLLKELEQTGKIRSTYAYPIQAIRFGSELTMVALAGEVVVDYSLRLKRELAGPAVWIAGYSNDVFGYVPSHRVLKEGGYEGGDAMRNTSLPGPFAPSVEDRIISRALQLARRPLAQAP